VGEKRLEVVDHHQDAPIPEQLSKECHVLLQCIQVGGQVSDAETRNLAFEGAEESAERLGYVQLGIHLERVMPDQTRKIGRVRVGEFERARPLAYTRWSVEDDAAQAAGRRECLVGLGHWPHPTDETVWFLREVRQLQLLEVELDRHLALWRSQLQSSGGGAKQGRHGQ
jgi:hypothetical protein